MVSYPILPSLPLPFPAHLSKYLCTVKCKYQQQQERKIRDANRDEILYGGRFESVGERNTKLYIKIGTAKHKYYETSFRIKLASRNGNLFRYFVIFDIK